MLPHKENASVWKRRNFSMRKKRMNHEAAVALDFMHHNICRIHKTLRAARRWKPVSRVTFGPSQEFVARIPRLKRRSPYLTGKRVQTESLPVCSVVFENRPLIS